MPDVKCLATGFRIGCESFEMYRTDSLCSKSVALLVVEAVSMTSRRPVCLLWHEWRSVRFAVWLASAEQALIGCSSCDGGMNW